MPKIALAELNKAVSRLEAKLNKAAEVKGASVMADVASVPNTYFLRRPSGIIGLDIDTGGGLPAGGLTYVSGPENAGKSFLLYKYFAMNQRLYGEGSAIFLAVTESPPDHFFMRKCGVQIAVPEEMIEQRNRERKERGFPTYTKEELKEFRQKTVGKLKIIRGAHGEEVLNAVIAAFETKVFDIGALDSISAILPKADAEKDLDEAAKRAAAANILTEFFKHYLSGTTGYYGTNPTTLIFTSQVRSNQKKAEALPHIQKYLKDWAPTGAYAARHGKLLDITVWSGSREKEEAKVDDAPHGVLGDLGPSAKRKVVLGKKTHYEITKGKAGVHDGITGEFDFNYEKLTDDLRSLVVMAIRRGIVIEDHDERVGAGYTVLRYATKEPYSGLVKLPLEKIIELLREDFELELSLRRDILSAHGIECTYR